MTRLEAKRQWEAKIKKEQEERDKTYSSKEKTLSNAAQWALEERTPCMRQKIRNFN